MRIFVRVFGTKLNPTVHGEEHETIGDLKMKLLLAKQTQLGVNEMQLILLAATSGQTIFYDDDILLGALPHTQLVLYHQVNKKNSQREMVTSTPPCSYDFVVEM